MVSTITEVVTIIHLVNKGERDSLQYFISMLVIAKGPRRIMRNVYILTDFVYVMDLFTLLIAMSEASHVEGFISS